jgi:hypothetical protein
MLAVLSGVTGLWLLLAARRGRDPESEH